MLPSSVEAWALMILNARSNWSSFISSARATRHVRSAVPPSAPTTLLANWAKASGLARMTERFVGSRLG